MREIKFRAWDKRDKMWSYDEFYINEDGSVYEIINSTFAMQTVTELEDVTNDVEVVFFTGLKDKNGKEIYEGDILSAFYGTQKTTVEWDQEFGLWTIVLQVSGATEPHEELLGNHLDVVEVIGNIYENPELVGENNG